MKKKRIYFLINSMEGGGAERVIANLCEQLVSEFEIDIITLKSGVFYPLPKEVRHVSLSNIQKNFLLIFLFPFFVFKFKKLLRENAYYNGISFLEIANFINIFSHRESIISFRTNMGVFRGILGFFYKTLIRYFYPKAKYIIVNSEENRHDLSHALDVSLDKIYTLYNPIDKEKVLSEGEKSIDEAIIRRGKGKKVFITVGRLLEKGAIGSKNHHTILEAFGEIYHSTHNKDFTYLIVGDGPALGSLRSLSERLGIGENVIFTGRQKNVFPYLRHADYMIYASENEGFPNVLIEGLVLGLPIISSNFKTGSEEIILGSYTGGPFEKYPIFGPNGVLLEGTGFKKQFIEIYPKLDTLVQKQVGIDHFSTSIEGFRKMLHRDSPS